MQTVEKVARGVRDTEEDWKSKFNLNSQQWSLIQLVVKRKRDTRFKLDALADCLSTIDDHGHKFSPKEAAVHYQNYVLRLSVNCGPDEFKRVCERCIKDLRYNGVTSSLVLNHVENHTPLTHLITGVDQLHLGLSIKRESKD